MEFQEIAENVKEFAGTSTGRVVLIGAGALGVGFLVLRSRRTGVPSATGASLPTGGIVASQATPAGGSSGSSSNPALDEIEAQKGLIEAQTEAQIKLANFGLELAQKQQQQNLETETARFDAQYGGNDVSMLSLAGVGSIDPRTGTALSATRSPRTRPVPVSGSGLESGQPTDAGKSVLQSIAEALGLGVAQGESRASIMARLTNYQASEAAARETEALRNQDASYLQRLTANYNLQTEAMTQQYEQQRQLQQDQIKSQERANNPFSSIGNFFKTAAQIYTGSRSTTAPTVATPPINPNPTRPSVTSSGNYALLEPVYRAAQSGYNPGGGGDGSIFLGVA